MKFLYVWPSEFSAAFSLGIDDIHPESSSNGCDCGGDMDKGVLGLLADFVKEHPQVKITLFVTPNWMFKPQLRGLSKFQKKTEKCKTLNMIITRVFLKKWPNNRFRIDKSDYKEWCSYLKSLAETGNFEIALHGLTHLNPHIKHAAEFHNSSYDHCIASVKKAEEIVEKAGLPWIRGFSPPGWSVPQSLLKALIDRGFTYIAPSVDAKSAVSCYAVSKGAGLNGIPLFKPSLIEGGLTVVPRNYDIELSSVRRAKMIILTGGLIAVHAHIQNNYYGIRLGNGITPENIKRLDKLVSYIERNFRGKIWFTTFSEVASHFRE